MIFQVSSLLFSVNELSILNLNFVSIEKVGNYGHENVDDETSGNKFSYMCLENSVNYKIANVEQDNVEPEMMFFRVKLSVSGSHLRNYHKLNESSYQDCNQINLAI